MRFNISHETVYKYGSPASESVGELRLFPKSTSSQRIANRHLRLDPAVPVDTFEDFFGNTVECFAVPFRHSRLRVRMTAEVETLPAKDPGPVADAHVGEVRRLSHDRRINLYQYRLPTATVPLGGILQPLKRKFLKDSASLRTAVLETSNWIYKTFAYQPGVTTISTPLSTVIAERRGVCQDFAHLMLSILRTHGVPARYVSGYIEPNDPTVAGGAELIGAAASHAWIEVGLTDGTWWGIDPTNNQCAGERHVIVAVGRDYHDVAPLRGSYKGAKSQKLSVIVSIKRNG